VSLTEYQKKRDFKRTPEPKGTLQEAPPRPRYVVHRHHATRLHWDVRLEMRGVLVSFAVPQGPPLVPGKRRLAVHTEDHPIEYLTFHGVIPDGYGAGSMTIWDEGTYELLLEKPEQDGRRGEYKIQFHGARLTGEYVIVQTTAHEGRDWLMIMHGTPPKDDPLARKIEPMLASSADEPFDSPQFTYEPKWDGVRTLAFVDGGEVRLQTRNLLDCTKQYPEAHGAAEALTGAYQAILDGEIVAFDDKGVPSFQRLQPRMHLSDEGTVSKLRKSVPVIYEVFDVLYLDGEDLTKQPLRERRRRLEAALQPMGPIRLSEGFPGNGVALFNAAREQGLEGIVAKRLDSPYVSGRSAAWVKIKAFKSMDCVIGGWTEGQGGRHATLGALIVGVYRDGKLMPVGQVGSGFDDRTLRDLLPLLKEHQAPESPFAVPPKVNQPATWCFPDLVCEVRYAEITRDGTLRHPVYLGLRQDVDPIECTGQETAASAKEALRKADRAARSEPPAEVIPVAKERTPSTLEIDGHVIKLTNLEKVLFPEDGYTKADLIRYYTEVSPYLIPVIRDRPLTLKPFPDGISGMSFYQKDKPSFTPKWIKTWTDHEADREGGIEYILGNDLATLVWMANYTAIEIHPWLSRIDKPDNPDLAMIDLDPATGATWDDVKEAAMIVRDLLHGLDLEGFPKTTGSRGIHVLVPIARRYTFDESRSFVEEIGKAARERAPKLITLTFAKKERRGIYVDYLQNVRGKTTAGPYSVRPIRRAPVSAPLKWDEISALGRPDAFTIANLPARLEKVGDLLKPMLKLQQKLPAKVFTTGTKKTVATKQTTKKTTARKTQAGGRGAAPATK
jgi:bifunctional non-homologous end joining protein LigD